MANDFNIKFDLSPLVEQMSYFKDIDKKLATALDSLAGQAYEKAIELAQQKLKSRRDTYLKHLSFTKQGQGNDTVYLIVLSEEALWIEEGMSAHNMKDTHLNGKDKVIIPFQHNKGMPSMMPKKQAELYKEVKSFLKKNKMSLNKPIMDKAGKSNISSAGNVKPAASFGSVPSKHVSKKTGESVLNRLNVYQHQSQTKTGKTKTTSTAMTFRTLSQNSDKSEWNVPQLPPAKILDEVYDWILQNYEKIMQESIGDVLLKGG